MLEVSTMMTPQSLIARSDTDSCIRCELLVTRVRQEGVAGLRRKRH
jgi:hypothetical protein